MGGWDIIAESLPRAVYSIVQDRTGQHGTELSPLCPCACAAIEPSTYSPTLPPSPSPSPSPFPSSLPPPQFLSPSVPQSLSPLVLQSYWYSRVRWVVFPHPSDPSPFPLPLSNYSTLFGDLLNNYYARTQPHSLPPNPVRHGLVWPGLPRIMSLAWQKGTRKWLFLSLRYTNDA